MRPPNEKGGRATTPSPLETSLGTDKIQTNGEHGNLDVVPDLASRCLRTFPLQHNSKVPPKGESWLDKAAIRHEHDWSTGNLAVATGNGIIILDFDNKPDEPDKNGMLTLAMWDMLDELPTSFRVRTPSGGVHVYLYVPKGWLVANSQSKIAPGVDVRGENGYVVAPGSTINGRRYEILVDAPVAEATPEVLSKLAPPHERVELGFSVDMDTDHNVKRAVHYLRHHAPGAIEGQGGDLATFKVACRVKDLGVSEGMCHSLMLEHWNSDPERVSPAWSDEGLAAKVSSAYRNGSLPPGIATAAAEFGDDAIPPEEAERMMAAGLLPGASSGLVEPEGAGQGREPLRMPTVAPWGKRDLAGITVPEAIYPSGYTPGLIMVTAANPKVGKSAAVLAECVDMASGRGFLTGEPKPPRRVLYINMEDPQNVVDSRVAALVVLHELDQSEIEGTLFVASALDSDFRLAQSDGAGAAAFPPGEAWLRETIRHLAIDVVVMDPLQDLSHADESNESFRSIGRVLRGIAVGENVAIGLVHHTRKGVPGVAKSIEDMRGGSALRGISRITRMYSAMTAGEAKKAGVPDGEEWRYFRISAYEATHLAPGSAAVQWYQKVSVALPSGKPVVAVKTWEWPANATGLPDDQVCRVLKALDAVLPEYRRGHHTAEFWAGKIVMRTLDWADDDKAAKERAKALLHEWQRLGYLGADTCTWNRETGLSALKVLKYPWPDQGADEDAATAEGVDG